MRLQQIKLTNFRNYESFHQPIDERMIAFTGQNGAGKTNLLEAISLLAPGRGLRRAALDEFQNTGAKSDAWRVFLLLEDNDRIPLKIGTGRGEWNAQRQRYESRRIRINGNEAKQNDLSAYLDVLWLTPLEDRLWTGSPTGRRSVIDRMAASFIPDHSAQLSRYERSLRERQRHLEDSDLPDPIWLDAIESVLAASGVAVTSARHQVLETLNAIVTTQTGPFPKGRFFLKEDALLSWILGASAAQAEQRYKDMLKRVRQARPLALGPHRGDWDAVFLPKNVPAGQSSTGEQKALLMTLVIAHARALVSEKGRYPILLLDEVCAHFDEARRKALFKALRDSQMQVFMTGTEDGLFLGNQIQTIPLACG